MHLSKTIKPTLWQHCLAGLVLAAGGATVASAAVTWKDIQFGGFFSQGYLQSTNNNYPVDTKDGTFDFREYALNASTTFGAHLRVGAQVYAEKLGKYGDDQPLLDWAVVDYNFRPELGVQVGRLKYPRSLYSDVLDVDMVRPFILLPQSIYDARLRDFQASFDGAKVYGSVSIGDSSFDYKAFYGKIPVKTDSGVADYFNTTGIYANPPGVTSIEIDDVRGAALTWSTPFPGLRFGLNYSYLTNLEAIGPMAQLPTFPMNILLTKVEYTGASVEYTTGPWTFAGEYLVNNIDTVVILPSFISPPTKSKSGTRSYYVSIARRVGSKFEVGTYYSSTNAMYPDPTKTPDTYHSRDLAVAVRYDVNDHLLFKIEAHWIDGTSAVTNVPGISNPPGKVEDSMTLLAAKTTLSF